MKLCLSLCLVAGVLGAVPAEACPPQVAWGLQDLVKRADAGFLGRVEALREEPLPEKGMCFTHVTFSIQDLLFDRTGTLLEPKVTLVFAGGHLGDEIVRISGVPSFLVGERAVVLTLLDGKRYPSPIVGGDQGLFRLAFDARDGSAYPLASGGRGIEAVRKGSILATDRVERIEGGRPRYQEGRTGRAPAKAPPPAPSPGSPATQTARESEIHRARPERLLSLAAFLDALRSLHAELPEGRRK